MSGNPYPANILRADLEVDLEGFVDFTDSGNQPGGPPFAPAPGGDLTILTDSTGANALIYGGDDSGGVVLRSQDTFSEVLAVDGGVVIYDAHGLNIQSGVVGQVGIATRAIVSGPLPQLEDWVSGTAQLNPLARDITVVLEVVSDGTANAATCAVALSPDNTTYTTVATPGVSAAVNTVGAVTQMVAVPVPVSWYLQITFADATIAASYYY